MLESLRGMRPDIVDMLARIDVAEAAAATLPHREKYLLLNHRLARRVLEAHLQWLDEVEAELAPKGSSGRAPRRSRSSP